MTSLLFRFILIPALTVVLTSFLHSEEFQLFNGRDLTGWEGATEIWRVEEGVLLGGSLDGNPQNEFLAFKDRFQNFVLEFDYRLTGTEGFINGGVQFRSERIKEPANEMRGYQADIGAGYSGALYDESRRKKMLAQPSPELLAKTERQGEWNTYKVHVEGNRIQLFLNDVRTVDYTENEKGIEDNGLIALQIHGNCKAVIAFRNLTLTKLPATTVRAEGKEE